MSELRHQAQRNRHGFTLVELLTVIAIIAVLATLLLTALASAKKKSRQAFCTSNLHQVSLALNMYLDDFPKRPSGFSLLAAARFLPSTNALRCPEDRLGNWGGLTRGEMFATDEAIPYSYLQPLPWTDGAWNYLNSLGSAAGVAACQLHGLGKPNYDFPSIHDFEGLVLRVRRDAAVIRTHVYWDTFVSAASDVAAPPPMAAPTAGASAARTPAAPAYPWKLFVDEPPTNLTDIVEQP
ncbi:MAG: prepilin-type N-terminal cleavage/methylation domain-containing protein [Verrucomicrobia bacterium]|nr:prepilin-type N-terminal cleavage/methylation domain-containing protein [Verrucomicrobiota bacterium]